MANNNGKAKPLGITHISIRSSLSILVSKLVVLEIIFAVIVSISYIIFVDIFGFSLLLALIITKIVLIIYVLLSWTNEYFEITADQIIHYKGIFFKKEKRYSITNIRQIILHQGFLGKLMDFGTIEFFDYAVKKYFRLYQIHNPQRYFNLLNEIVPDHDEIEETIRDTIVDTDTTI